MKYTVRLPHGAEREFMHESTFEAYLQEWINAGHELHWFSGTYCTVCDKVAA